MRQIRFITWGIASFAVVTITQSVPGNGQTPPSFQDSDSNIIRPDLVTSAAEGQQGLSVKNPAQSINFLQNSRDSIVSKVDTSDQQKATLNPNNLSQAGQVNLSGEWIFESPTTVSFTGNCTGIASESNTKSPVDFNIIQNGENLTFPGSWAQYNGFLEGRISGNQFTTQSRTFSNLRLEGTVSSDGNKITGTLFCTKNIPFTITRKNPQPPQSADLCNSGTVTSPTTVTTSHDGSPYQVWTDFRRGKESINPAACGRQYWLKEDPNHPNNGIKFVYLVDARNVCIVPFIYKENPDGSLESLRPAPECSSAQATPQPVAPQTIEEKRAFRKSDQQVAAELAALRERGKREGWTFEVGDSQAFRILLELLAGTRIPENFRPNVINILDILTRLIQDASRNNPQPVPPQPVPPQPAPPRPIPNPNQLPNRFDAREWGVVPEIRNQGDCASCWAFAAVSAQEITYSSLYKQPSGSLNLSEQQIFSCNTQGATCERGGYVSEKDSEYQYESGLVGEQAYPYEEQKTSCRTFGRPTSGNLFDIKAFQFVLGGNDDPSSPANITKIKQAIYAFGSVVTGVYSEEAFAAYKGGVFNACSNNKADHAINIIGWDDAGGYWIVRNSWGNWGENGYMKIKYGCNKIGEYAAVPKLPVLADCNGGNCQPRNPSSPPWLGGNAQNPVPLTPVQPNSVPPASVPPVSNPNPPNNIPPGYNW